MATSSWEWVRSAYRPRVSTRYLAACTRAACASVLFRLPDSSTRISRSPAFCEARQAPKRSAPAVSPSACAVPVAQPLHAKPNASTAAATNRSTEPHRTSREPIVMSLLPAGP
ncbi:hypothetical protein C1Y40_03202 [Mycobacterium talmoniae]|uniref:Uncharacterized protein n=1 Tax=Mycobacterium talmoniae TaxID=1858794 RepID=A0A2S8BJ24_9MYCO|nr:hypothetical protein C1Y40_03202 [Mycobacterium talmoniae]